MRKEDPRIVAARLKVEGASIRTSTSSKYSSQWKEYVAHSEDCEEDPFQAGKHEKLITEHLVYFVLYRLSLQEMRMVLYGVTCRQSGGTS